MTLVSTQPLREMNTRRRCVRLTTLPPSCAVVMKSGNLNFPEPSGTLQACNGTALPFTLLLCPNVVPLCELLHVVYVTLISDVSGTARISETSVMTVTSTKSEFVLTVQNQVVSLCTTRPKI